MNLSHAFTESDFKPHLWRKITEAEKRGMRKVRAMWSVRKRLTAGVISHRLSYVIYPFVIRASNYLRRKFPQDAENRSPSPSSSLPVSSGRLEEVLQPLCVKTQLVT